MQRRLRSARPAVHGDTINDWYQGQADRKCEVHLRVLILQLYNVNNVGARLSES